MITSDIARQMGLGTLHGRPGRPFDGDPLTKVNPPLGPITDEADNQITDESGNAITDQLIP